MGGNFAPKYAPDALQPLYLDPEVNVVTQIGPWTRFREPVEFDFRPGQPHTWRAIGTIREVGRVADALLFIDGDRDTYYASQNYTAGGGQGGVQGEVLLPGYGSANSR